TRTQMDVVASVEKVGISHDADALPFQYGCGGTDEEEAGIFLTRCAFGVSLCCCGEQAGTALVCAGVILEQINPGRGLQMDVSHSAFYLFSSTCNEAVKATKKLSEENSRGLLHIAGLVRLLRVMVTQG